MRFWRGVFLVLLSMLAAQAALAQRAPVYQSFDLRVPWMPEPVVVAGKTSLVSALASHFGLSVYTLNLADFSDRSLAACASSGAMVRLTRSA